MDMFDFLALRNNNKINILNTPIYGVAWNNESLSKLVRFGQSEHFVANPCLDTTPAQNDFETADIFKDITEVTDSLGNVFVRIPKFYIKKAVGPSTRIWAISKKKWDDTWYLPKCFYDFINSVELPYVDIGKYPASLGANNKLESKAGVYPLVSTHIVNFRTYANNNNVDGLLGYQQLDIHAYDMLQVLFYVMFATLNSQNIMAGWTGGNYVATDTATAETVSGNTIQVTNAVGAKYAIGQPISLGSSLGSTSIFYGRDITNIQVDTPEAGTTTITFDGDPVNIAIGSVLFNSGWKNGWSSGLAQKTGSIGSNTTAKFPMAFLGIENLYGNIWQFVDGININERQSWVCDNAAEYVSNVFAAPYKQVGYVNGSADGYAVSMGHDPDNPMVSLPVSVGGATSTFYGDYYYQTTGQRIAHVGGVWNYGAYAGLTYWDLSDTSSIANVNLGGRLLKKPL